jgi:hypothetical protein
VAANELHYLFPVQSQIILQVLYLLLKIFAQTQSFTLWIDINFSIDTNLSIDIVIGYQLGYLNKASVLLVVFACSLFELRVIEKG